MTTFLVRIWTPTGPERVDDLRGVLEHVSTGWTSTFVGGAALVDLLRRIADSGDDPPEHKTNLT